MAQWGMARNMRAKGGRESKSPKVEADNTTIEQASPKQLADWLDNPPRKDLHRAWRNAPWPLRRAVELERKDLFAKWIEHGCSPAGNLDLGVPLVCLTGGGTPRFIEWVCQYSPRHLIDVLDQLRAEQMAPVYMREVNWHRIINSGSLEQKTLTELATMAFSGAGPGLPVEDLLRATGGRISEGWNLERALVRHSNSYTKGYHDVADGEADQKIARQVNNLPAGALLDADCGIIASCGLLFTAKAAIEQVLFNAEYADLNIKKTPVRNFRQMFISWSMAGKGVAEDELNDAIDSVSPYIQWRRRDRNGCFALHSLALDFWPQGSVEHLLETIIQTQPSMLDQKNKDGLRPEENPENSNIVRDYIRSYKKRAGMGKILKHNVRQTQAILERHRNQIQSQSAPGRKPFM